VDESVNAPRSRSASRPRRGQRQQSRRH
jgi:hypothetical protein